MFPEPPSSNLTLVALTEQQQAICALLSEFSTAAEQFDLWYRGALETIARKGPDYLAQAAHSIRELTDRLPERAGVPRFESPVPAVKSAVPKLLNLKAKRYQKGWEGALIDGELSDVLSELERVYRLFKAPARTARLMLALTAKDPYKHLLSQNLQQQRDRLFKKLGDFFQNVAHHNHTPGEPDFLERLETFERLLLRYLTPVTAEQQVEILVIISQGPTAESKARLQDLLVHSGSNLALVLEKLEDPHWLQFLVELGLFKEVPGPESGSDGGLIYRRSPGLSMLARLASRAPGEALKIIEDLPKTENPLVVDQIMRCISRIDERGLAKRLLAVLRPLLNRQVLDGWIWIGEILSSWLRIGAIEEAIKLLRDILGIGASIRETAGSNQIEWQLQQIDEHVIAKIAASQALEMAEVVFRALIQWAKIENSLGGSERTLLDESGAPRALLKDDGPSTYWLEDLKILSFGSNEFPGLFARRLYVIGKSIFESGDEARIEAFDSILRSDSWELFQRIRMQLYADFPGRSLRFARNDILEAIPHLGSGIRDHNYEFAQMLEANSTAHGAAFLTAEEVATFLEAVLAGPKRSDLETPDDGHRDYFYRTQLYPVRSLLTGEGLALYQRLSEGKTELKLNTFKPFSSGGGGTVRSVAPARANEMDLMSNEELWSFLNTWEPSTRFPDPENWLLEEDVGALGRKFAEFLEAHPQRFPPESRWWENLHRAAILHKPLEHAPQRMGKKPEEAKVLPQPPTETEWRNWFGLAAWITEQASIAGVAVGERVSHSSDTPSNWNWPRMVVVKFLVSALTNASAVPEDLQPEVGRLLRKLVEDEDTQLIGRDRPWLDDWFTTAINSVRGTAVEGLLDLALTQKRANPGEGPEGWILEVLEKCLHRPDQSPAVFAILGARAGLFFHLFGEFLGDATTLVLPPDRDDSKTEFTLAHFRYHSPMPAILKSLPKLPNVALDCLVEFAQENEDQLRARRDFGGKLGMHLAFYYWNNAYQSQESADEILDRFFEVADPEGRSSAIDQIGKIFRTAPSEPKHASLYQLCMRLWDRRFGYIEELIETKKEAAANFDGELSEFVDWLACECFPFEWRYDRVLRAINRLEKSPRAHSLVKTLDLLSNSGEHLHEVMTILHSVVSKDSDVVRWLYPEEHLKLVLQRGLASAEAKVKKLAVEIQEIFLRHGCFEYLNLAKLADPEEKQKPTG